MCTVGSDDDLEYYVRECGDILGVTTNLAQDKRDAKHILEHIFTQVVEFKKLNQVKLWIICPCIFVCLLHKHADSVGITFLSVHLSVCLWLSHFIVYGYMKLMNRCHTCLLEQLCWKYKATQFILNVIFYDLLRLLKCNSFRII